MAKHFRMEFKSPRGQNMYWDGGSDFRTEKDCGLYGGEKYYIHPDSLQLLEPLKGDFVTFQGSRVVVFCPELHSELTRSLAKIIYRNGLPFMWPKVEK
jgi:hypothetical protein